MSEILWRPVRRTAPAYFTYVETPVEFLALADDTASVFVSGTPMTSTATAIMFSGMPRAFFSSGPVFGSLNTMTAEAEMCVPSPKDWAASDMFSHARAQSNWLHCQSFFPEMTMIVEEPKNGSRLPCGPVALRHGALQLLEHLLARDHAEVPRLGILRARCTDAALDDQVEHRAVDRLVGERPGGPAAENRVDDRIGPGAGRCVLRTERHAASQEQRNDVAGSIRWHSLMCCPSPSMALPDLGNG